MIAVVATGSSGTAAPPPARPATRSPHRRTPATCRRRARCSASTSAPGGRDRQSDRYLREVADASPRVSECWPRRAGPPVGYAIVGRPRTSRQPSARPASCATRDVAPKAAKVAAHAPAIAWDAGNVHGNEESGADAALRVLCDLADRTRLRGQEDPRQGRHGDRADPESRRPVLDYRRNSYGFDMNRDWFARTQPETDGKLRCCASSRPCCSSTTTRWATTTSSSRRTPTRSTTRSPTARCAGSTTSTAPRWRGVHRRGIPYFNYDIYDMFYMGYGDSVPMTGFLGVGMTFEKDNGDPIPCAFASSTWRSGRRCGPGEHKDGCCRGWAASVPAGLPRGPARPARAQRGVQAGQHGSRARCRTSRCATTSPARRRPRRPRCTTSSGGCSGWTSRSRTLTAPLQVHDYTPYGTQAGRGQRRCRAAPTGSRWRRRRSTGSRRCSARTATCRSRTSTTSPPGACRCSATSPAAGRARCWTRRSVAGRRQAKPAPATAAREARRRHLAYRPGQHLGVRVRGLAALAVRRQVAAALPHDQRATSRRRYSPASTCWWCPTATRKAAYKWLGESGRARCAWLADGGRLVAWRAAPSWRRKLALTTARLRDADLRRAGLAVPCAGPAPARCRAASGHGVDVLRVRQRDEGDRSGRCSGPYPTASSPRGRCPASPAARVSWADRCRGRRGVRRRAGRLVRGRAELPRLHRRHPEDPVERGLRARPSKGTRHVPGLAAQRFAAAKAATHRVRTQAGWS